MNQLTEQRIALDGTQHQSLDDLSMELPFQVKETYELIDFFHQNPRTILTDNKAKIKIKILNQLICICQEISQAAANFRQGKLMSFDAHIGESSCQIRAYYFVHLYNKKSVLLPLFINLEFLLKELITYCKNLINKLETTKELQGQIEFCEFFKKNSLNLTIQADLFFLTMANFLTQGSLFNDENVLQGINFEKLSQNWQTEKSTIVKFVTHYQQQISFLSCRAILNLAKETGCKKNLSGLVHLDEKNRSIFSCYYGTKILIEHALQFNISILLQISAPAKNHKTWQFNVLCSPNTLKNEFDISTSTITPTGKPAFTIRASTLLTGETLEQVKSVFTQNLMYHGIKNIILMDMARHAQYSGKKLTSYRYNPIKNKIIQKHFFAWQEEFLRYRKQADIVGCSIGNPRIFQLRHCYPGTLTIDLLKASSSLIISQPNQLNHFELWHTPLSENSKKLANYQPLIKWLDRSSGKLKIIVGDGLEQSLWGSMEAHESSQIYFGIQKEKASWKKQNNDFLKSVQASVELIDFEKYFYHEKFADTLHNIEILCNINAYYKFALFESITIACNNWQPLRKSLTLPNIPALAWRKYITHLASVLLIWQQEFSLPTVSNLGYPFLDLLLNINFAPNSNSDIKTISLLAA